MKSYKKTKSSKSKKKWFKPTTTMNWRKTDSQSTRRKNALKAHKNNALSTARALQALANVTQDNQTARLARSDAKHFFARYRRLNRGK